MGLYYENLDEKTREFMLKEIELDISNGRIYLGKHLNSYGQTTWVSLLREACQKFNDDWLAGQLRTTGCMKTNTARRTSKGGTTTARVPVTAPETLAEGEFNRFYARALCARAIKEGISHVEVYRGKSVMHPRPESQAKIGLKYSAKALLEDLRTSQGVEPCLGVLQDQIQV